MQNFKYEQFLSKHAIPKGSTLQSTHTRIGAKDLGVFGGNYHIPDSDMDEFWELYYDHVFVRGFEEHLTETQTEDGGVFIDLDFHHAPEVTSRMYDGSIVENICEVIGEACCEILYIDKDLGIPMFIMEKPNVNTTHDKKDKYTKDGLHIMLNIKMSFKMRSLLRAFIVYNLGFLFAEEFAEWKLVNTLEDIVDRNILETGTNWQVYGSRKPGNEAYMLREVFVYKPWGEGLVSVDFEVDDVDKLQCLSTKYNKRYDYNSKPVTDYSYMYEKVYKAWREAYKAPKSNKRETTFRPIDSSSSPVSVSAITSIEQTDDKDFDEMMFYATNHCFRAEVDADQPVWIRLGGMFKTAFPDDSKAFALWQAATLADGSENKIKECEPYFKYHIKAKSNAKPATKINQLRQQVKNAFPEIVKEWGKRAAEGKNFAANDREAAEIMRKQIDSDFIYTRKQIFLKKGHIWTNDTEMVRGALLHRIMQTDIYRTNEKNELIPYSQNVAAAKNILEALLSSLYGGVVDNLRYDVFHSTCINKLCFLDGVLCLVTKTFTLWDNVPENSIYTTVLINRRYSEYFAAPDAELIAKIKQDIFENVFGENTDLALRFFARAMGGNAEDKNFMSYCGNRNCGKGILYALFRAAFGDYVNSFSVDNLTCVRQSKKSSDNAKENAWILPLEFVRLAISQETEEAENGKMAHEGLKLNNTKLKSFMSGGDPIEARGMRENIRTINIDTTIAIFGNNEAIVSGKDSSQHHLKLTGVKQFVTQEQYDRDMAMYGEVFMSAFAVRDDTLKSKVKSDAYCNAFVYLIMQHFQANSLDISGHILANSDDEGADSIRKLIFKHFIVTGVDKDRISKDEVFGTLQGDSKKILAELKQMGCVGDCNCKMTMKTLSADGKEIKKQVQAFKGLVIKPILPEIPMEDDN